MRFAYLPLSNHYRNTALQITPRGLATCSLTSGSRSLAISFDFVSHELELECSDGGFATVRLKPQSVADFYR